MFGQGFDSPQLHLKRQSLKGCLFVFYKQGLRHQSGELVMYFLQEKEKIFSTSCNILKEPGTNN